MKKIILIIIILVFTAGCTNINKLSYDDIVNNITTISTKDNIIERDIVITYLEV